MGRRAAGSGRSGPSGGARPSGRRRCRSGGPSARIPASSRLPLLVSSLLVPARVHRASREVLCSADTRFSVQPHTASPLVAERDRRSWPGARAAARRSPWPGAGCCDKGVCTAIVSVEPASEYPVLLAGVRDEFHDRPWIPPGRHWPRYPRLIGGQDLLASGTWLAVDPQAPRVACVLNGRGPLAAESGRCSRGELPLRFAATGGVEGLDVRPLRPVPSDLRDSAGGVPAELERRAPRAAGAVGGAARGGEQRAGGLGPDRRAGHARRWRRGWGSSGPGCWPRPARSRRRRWRREQAWGPWLPLLEGARAGPAGRPGAAGAAGVRRADVGDDVGVAGGAARRTGCGTTSAARRGMAGLGWASSRTESAWPDARRRCGLARAARRYGNLCRRL